MYFTKAAPKIMPPVLLYWPTTSEADVGDMAIENELYHQYSILLLCDRWHQRGSLTDWHLTWKWVCNKGVQFNSSM